MGISKGMKFTHVVLALFCLMMFSVYAKAEEVTNPEDAAHYANESLFTIDANGLVNSYSGEDTEVVIPRKIGGVEVKGLTGTFKENTKIQKVYVPNTITTLGDDTFNGCTSFSALMLYDVEHSVSKETIVESNTQWMNNFSKYVGETSKETFYEIIEKGSCVIIPRTLTTMGERVFNYCSFVSFDVLEGNTSFCDSNEGGINLAEGVGVCLMSADKAKLYRIAPNFGGITGTTASYSIPDGVKEICPYAAHKTDFKKIIIPTSVTTIDDYGFFEVGAADVILFAEASNTKKIGQWAFAYDTNTDIKLPASVTEVGSYAFAYIVNRTPDISNSSITTLPAFVFTGCTNLHTIIMPKTLLTIEAYAFKGNTNLNEVVFTGDRLDKIGTGAFQDCTNMHKIDVPEGVTAIENDTFSGCTNLNDVILPDSLKIIGDNAFADCQNIHNLVIPPNVDYISNSSFDGVDQSKIDTSKNTYAQTVIKGVLLKVGESKTVGKLVYKVTKSDAVAGTVTVVKAINKKQKTVVIPPTVNINGYEFKVTAISSKAFKKNTKLTTVTIGENVKTIGKEAFSGCKKLKKINVKSSGISKVNKNAFKSIHKKATIKLPKMSSKKFKKYKKKFLKKGQAKTVKIKK